MATTVESPGITSAKEEAAAILFARETQTPPVMSAPAPEQPVREHEYHPVFASYHEPVTITARPKAVDTTELRPYKTYEEVVAMSEPIVVHPGIDSGDYTSSVATTSVVVEEPVTTAVENTKTVAAVESPLDRELEENTQYVVKFKKSTVAVVSLVASIVLLMAVLLVVNIVNLVTMSAEISALTQESAALEAQLNQGQHELEATRHAANNTNKYTVRYVTKETSTYQEPVNATVDSSFFDWLCHSLSRLFS